MAEKLTRRQFLLRIASVVGGAFLGYKGYEQLRQLRQLGLIDNTNFSLNLEPGRIITTTDGQRFIVGADGKLYPVAAQPSATATETDENGVIATATPQNERAQQEILPYFVAPEIPNISLLANSPLLANNGPDSDGIDHQNPYMPRGAGWFLADPGHYRVDNLANVTDPNTRASIEKDIRNGAAYVGDDYKQILDGNPADIPVFENGGSVVFTSAQPGRITVHIDDKSYPFVFGRQPNHSWVVIFINDKPRDNARGTDNNIKIHIEEYDGGFTMWQAIPPGQFPSAWFVCQTIADAHGSYRNRGTSPGAGHDGVNTVSLAIIEVLPDGQIAYGVYQHQNLGPWEQYKPNDFKPVATNFSIQ